MRTWCRGTRAALTLGWRRAYAIGAARALAALLVAPRDAVGRGPTPSTPGERATGALPVIGIAAGPAGLRLTLGSPPRRMRLPVLHVGDTKVPFDRALGTASSTR